MRRHFISLFLLPLLTGCSLYQSDGKKYLKEQAITVYNDNLNYFSLCNSSTTAPEFLNDDHVDEFSNKSNLFGFLDTEHNKFWSYTIQKNKHFYCESNLAQLNRAGTPFYILQRFENLVTEYIK